MKNMVKDLVFDPIKYKYAVDDYVDNWQLIDDILYQTCRKYPNHSDRAFVNTKVNLIGYSYRTNIERLYRATEGPNSTLARLVSHLVEHSGEVDDIISQLPGNDDSFSFEILEGIVNMHGRFARLVRQSTDYDKYPRSFASKYLHFHCSLVPIFDSYASDNLRSLIKGTHYRRFPCPREADYGL